MDINVFEQKMITYTNIVDNPGFGILYKNYLLVLKDHLCKNHFYTICTICHTAIVTTVRYQSKKQFLLQVQNNLDNMRLL